MNLVASKASKSNLVLDAYPTAATVVGEQK